MTTQIQTAIKNEYTLRLADPRATLAVVGGKGASLARLAEAGLPVPGGFHVTTAAYRQFVAENDLQPRILAALELVNADQLTTLETASRTINDLFAQASLPPDIAAAIAQAYASLPGDDPAVAVRSSATAEDLPEASFAGQQETFLNVRGVTGVRAAIQRCWASLWTARAIRYRMQHDIDQEAISLAVVVQMLVSAEAAGVLFTANPVNGRRDQAVISAAWGLGEAIVGGLVTPDTITVDKETSRVLARETADKEVMTIRVASGTEERPVPEDLRHAPVLDDQVATVLAQLGIQIETLYNCPMDIEWTLADGELAIVQARPITALPEPEAATPTEWPLPHPKGQYMRSSIVDLMPDPLSPLFATLGLSAINAMLRRLLQRAFNSPPETLPENTVLTINGYAYMIVSFSPKQWWLMLTRMVPRFPRLLRTGVPYWREVAHPRYLETVERWEARSLQDLSTAELLRGIREVLEVATDHLGALMASTMGPSAGSEGLFTRVYERMIKRPQDPPAPTFLLGFDSIPIQAEKALYDQALWCREREPLAAYLTNTPTKQIAAQLDAEETPTSVDMEVWQAWKSHFRAYLKQYGYSIYTLDVAQPLPLDDPTPLLETLKLFIAGQGKSPYERQQAFAGQREQAVQAVQARLKGIKRWAFKKSLNWAQSLVPLRETGIAEIGLGYPLLRRMLDELGGRLTQAGAIAEADDIFWLEETEVEALINAMAQAQPVTNFTEVTRQRQAEWRAAKRVTPPPQLPFKGKYLGVGLGAWGITTDNEAESDTIKGVGASPGRVTATACVLHGPEDFDQMRPGDILVAGTTTPAWTPLFTIAAGVVTDVGGPLSHGSIVAREYGIPAVLGTGVATKRIRSGRIITVDGSAGTVSLSNSRA